MMKIEDLLRGKIDRVEAEVIAVRAENRALRQRLKDAQLDMELARQVLAYHGLEIQR
jgi:hypothetical protein